MMLQGCARRTALQFGSALRSNSRYLQGWPSCAIICGGAISLQEVRSGGTRNRSIVVRKRAMDIIVASRGAWSTLKQLFHRSGVIQAYSGVILGIALPQALDNERSCCFPLSSQRARFAIQWRSSCAEWVASAMVRVALLDTICKDRSQVTLQALKMSCTSWSMSLS